MTHQRATLLCVGLLASGCLGKSEADREAERMKEATPQRLQADGSIRLTEDERRALDLATVPAVEEDLPDAVLHFGRVRSRFGQEAFVMAPTAGRIAGPPLVELGALVEANAPLLTVVPVLGAGERVTLRLQGADIQGQIDTTARALDLRETEARRARKLATEGLIDAASLQTAETAAAMARAQLDALRRARAVQQGGDSASLVLRAPIAGVVVGLDVDVGAVTQAGEILVRIVKPGALWVDVAIPPDEPSGAGYEVIIGARTLPARLAAVGGVVEPSGMRLDRLELQPNDGPGPLPGATVAVRVLREAMRGVVVPESAIVATPEGDRAYVEQGPGLFGVRAVKVAARAGGRVRLASGVAAGETVVTRGAAGLRGETVRAELRHVE